MSAVR